MLMISSVELSIIPERRIREIVWSLSPVIRAKSITSFWDSIWRLKGEFNFSMWCKRGIGSQVWLYLGRDGLNRERPFLNRFIIGLDPRFPEQIKDSAEVWELNVPYLMLLLFAKDWRNTITSFVVGLKTEISSSSQNFHHARYVLSYWRSVDADIEDDIVSIADSGTFLVRKACLIISLPPG